MIEFVVICGGFGFIVFWGGVVGNCVYFKVDSVDVPLHYLRICLARVWLAVACVYVVMVVGLGFG